MRAENGLFELPSKIEKYLATLSRLYRKQNNSTLQSIVVNGAVSIHEEWSYDNWDGGTYGHALTLTLPEDLYVEIMDAKDEHGRRICEDIGKLDNTQNEFIEQVFIEMESADSDQWRANSGVLRPRIAASTIPSDALSRIWSDGHVRVFLSHKANIKARTSKLKQAMTRCGVSCFVAHEDIKPNEEWQKEIERALFSMDALVALLTEDYHDSDWTDQESGVAIGRGVPVIAIRLGRDPYGLMGKGQGVGGCDWADTDSMAAKIFEVLYRRLPDKSRLFKAALSAYASSESFADSAWKVTHLLAMCDTLTESQVEQVVDAYRNNNQNRSSFAGRDSLKPLLEKWTAKHWTVANNGLVPANDAKPLADNPLF